jgi:hypothetical protein
MSVPNPDATFILTLFKIYFLNPCRSKSRLSH